MLQSFKNWIKKHTTKSKSDTSNTQTNAKEPDNNDYSNKRIVRIPIDDTPFEIITMLEKPKENNSFIAIGNQRITELVTKEELIHQIEHGNWDLMIKVMVHIAGKMIDGSLDMIEEKMKKN